MGDFGAASIIPKIVSQSFQRRIENGYKNHNFNQFISDLLPLNRRLKDVRDPMCKELHYSENLAPTSVVICFHNEALSTLLRTVNSVLQHSPHRLIKEIILVDDYSDNKELGFELNRRLKTLDKLKLVRTSKREGLVRARVIGVKMATAPIVTFLDSHCECTKGWLQPLLHRLSQDPTTVVCPVIDIIDSDTFNYKNLTRLNFISVGGFSWNLNFVWHLPTEKELKRRLKPTDPIATATLAGGLFAINKDYFQAKGGYDIEYEIWGAENLELSFKTWMCGGRLEIIPCSHIGHVFRKKHPYKFHSNSWLGNFHRLAEVWMDHYNKYYYEHQKKDASLIGNISERVQLRRRLNCKSFEWYLNYIYPKMFIEEQVIAFGVIRNQAMQQSFCIDRRAENQIAMSGCQKKRDNQHFLWSTMAEIRNKENCVQFDGNKVTIKQCHRSGGNQVWRYSKSTKRITHSKSMLCLRMTESKLVSMHQCVDNDLYEKWILEHISTLPIIADQRKQIIKPPFYTEDYKFLGSVDK